MLAYILCFTLFPQAWRRRVVCPFTSMCSLTSTWMTRSPDRVLSGTSWSLWSLALQRITTSQLSRSRSISHGSETTSSRKTVSSKRLRHSWTSRTNIKRAILLYPTFTFIECSRTSLLKTKLRLRWEKCQPYARSLELGHQFLAVRCGLFASSYLMLTYKYLIKLFSKKWSGNCVCLALFSYMFWICLKKCTLWTPTEQVKKK